ncbi:hypothetical protein PINS_up010672 [Pythium insidiosum]|nr:hypothetical protein PINS_up010672 [Pythium insidiosum]
MTTTEFLQATSVIDVFHPSIQRCAQSITSGLSSDRDKAVAIHDFVRDRILFGFSRRFVYQRASDVLQEGKGFCNTQSTLFTALLRAAGIPARIHYVSIDASILHGLDIPGPYVDHSFTEVFLDGRWIATDSYIVDSALFRSGIGRLERERLDMGYGLHRRGTIDWDGATDAFSQYIHSAEQPISSRDFGVFADYKDFYACNKDAFSGGWAPYLFMPLVAPRINATIDSVRQWGADT